MQESEIEALQWNVDDEGEDETTVCYDCPRCTKSKWTAGYLHFVDRRFFIIHHYDKILKRYFKNENIEFL